MLHPSALSYLLHLVILVLSCLIMFCGCVRALSSSGSGSTTGRTYDVLVVGGGSAGLTAAKFAGDTMKKSVLIIEKEKLGGDCTWTGCVPSKSMIASAKAAMATRRMLISGNKAPSATGYAVNFRNVKERYKSNQQLIYEEDDSPDALAKFGVETTTGKARLVSTDTINISHEEKTFDVKAKEGIILCTGAAPKVPTIPGLESVDYVTYEKVWDLDELPKKLTVVGGGPVGAELAQAFSRLGSDVTIVTSSRLLPREEPEVGAILKEVFEDEGITVVEGRLSQIKQGSGGKGHTISCKLPDNTISQVSGDTLLLSLGRTPNVDDMGLYEVGIDADETGIHVNEKLETTVQGIYAAGDCTGGRQFTHYAGFQGAIAARNILLPLTDPGTLDEIPGSTFTSPEVASIGYTEADAKAKLGEGVVGVASMSLDEVDRAICDGETKGILKVMYHRRNGRILGATFMSPAAGEMISEIAVAMKAKMKFIDLAKVIHPYPSYSIALQLLAAKVYYEDVKKTRWIYEILKRLGL